MYETYFNNYDPSYNLFFKGQWYSYEEYGWIMVFEKDNRFYYIEGGYCVFSDCNHILPDFKDKEEIAEDYVLDILDGWKEDEFIED